MAAIYPVGPKNVPSDFTEPSSGYCWRVVLLLLSLAVAFAVYAALLAGTAWLAYKFAIDPWPRRITLLNVVARVFCVFATGLLFLYLLKGLFKGRGWHWASTVEVTRAEQPTLFAFLDQLCADTGAPAPHRVFINHEVNASVHSSAPLLSLILPQPKNLTIGLGLVQNFNLTEMKSVLAHELGHFAQTSMALDAYVCTANRVLWEIISGRDFLDDFLDQVRASDTVFALFAGFFAVILNALRLGLSVLFKGINLLNYSLLRQMEFNADRFSVKMAGSDSVGRSLERCVFADRVWEKLEADLWAAGDHKLYSRDIFSHFDRALVEIRRLEKNAQWGERPKAAGPAEFVFAESDEGGVPAMWSTHPPSALRERHAKAPYLPAEVDERPAWLLFEHGESLKESVSRAYYTNVHGLDDDVPLVDAAQAQTFFDADYAEMTYDARYAGFYDDRYLELKDLHCLPTRTNYKTPEEAARDVEWLLETLPEWCERHRGWADDYDAIEKLLGEGRERPSFKGTEHSRRELQTMLDDLSNKLDEDGKTRTEVTLASTWRFRRSRVNRTCRRSSRADISFTFKRRTCIRRSATRRTGWSAPKPGRAVRAGCCRRTRFRS